MPADSFMLGVDGGATKTVALVARPDGSIVGAGRAGCGCIYATGMAGVPREFLASGTAFRYLRRSRGRGGPCPWGIVFMPVAAKAPAARVPRFKMLRHWIPAAR
jgi:hypothetical protein